MESKNHSTWQVAPVADSFSSITTEQDRTKNNMYEAFQTWALKTYGDSTKTKTVTRRKYNLILKILKGKEKVSAKFKHWVKAKGFQIGPLHKYKVTNSEQDLYIPSSKVSTNGEKSLVYKKVAVVEDFYDIIHEVHAGVDGFKGKHAGQKKTYKAVTEMYSFLPREAVTHFLILCTECQKRVYLKTEQSGASSNCHESIQENALGILPGNNSLHIDYNFPLTTIYRKYMQSLGYFDEESFNSDQEDSENIKREGNEEANSSQYPSDDVQMHDNSVIKEDFLNSLTAANSSYKKIKHGKYSRSLKSLQESMLEEPINIIKENFTNNQVPSYKNKANSCNAYRNGEDSSNLSVNITDEINEDNDKNTEKIDMNIYDSNRFEAFKMFVCLFVDENLDCMVPMSRQPKNKISEIVNSCSRQFPEFEKIANKQIQTYLKSCRQSKQTEENSNTQPQLTSVLAEEILANACKNENQNAQYIHLGLKHIPADISQCKFKKVSPQSHQENFATSCLMKGVESFSSFPHLVPSSLPNGHTSSLTGTNNGSADHSMENKVCSQLNISKHSLNPSEVITIKQLIACYRDSAALLLRSADELEQLLLELNVP